MKVSPGQWLGFVSSIVRPSECCRFDPHVSFRQIVCRFKLGEYLPIHSKLAQHSASRLSILSYISIALGLNAEGSIHSYENFRSDYVSEKESRQAGLVKLVTDEIKKVKLLHPKLS